MVTPPSTSERITARAVVQAAADHLADTVAGYLNTCGDAYWDLGGALDAYRVARDEARR